MAERRMFASKIIESDAFLDLSPQAQMLYVHLCMEADDDGFLNNARSIKRATGCTDKELNELFQKRFLLDLGDGVTVIKHWKINNYIQKDRYKPTAYQEKYELLEVKPNGAYTEKNKACIQQECERVYSLDTQEGANPVYSLDTQVSIGKVSIGKDIYKERVHKTFVKPTVEDIAAYCAERKNGISAQHFFDYYESNGWKVGRNSMKDWKATVRSWETRENSRKPDFEENKQSDEPQDFEAIKRRLFNETN